MAEKLFNQLAVSAAKSLASTFGSKIGGVFTEMLMEEIGVSHDRFDEVIDELKDIQARLDQMDVLLRQINHKLDWLHKDDVIADFKAQVDTYMRRIHTVITSDDSDDVKVAKIRKMLDESEAIAIETRLTAVHNMYVGNDGAIEGGKNLPETMFNSKWEMFGSSARQQTINDAANIGLGVFRRLADYQMKGTGLVYLRHALAEPTEMSQAKSVISQTRANLREQYIKLLEEAPDLIAYAMSGYPSYGPNANYSVSMKSMLPGQSAPYVKPVLGMYWSGKDVMEEQFATTPQEINLVPDPDQKGRWYLRSIDSWKAMCFEARQFMVEPGNNAHTISTVGIGGGHSVVFVPAIDATFHNFVTMVFNAPDADPTRTVIDIYTTTKPNQYVVGSETEGYAQPQHFFEDPNWFVKSQSGARSMDRYRVTVLPDHVVPSQVKGGVITIAEPWEIKVWEGKSEMLSRLQSSGSI
ncbi:hypothetical protein ACVFI8_01340 [Agarivorans sp. MS3-6]|uniref:hypothetical protein n=1 Tax=Agarivorans sp. TSD2052 TaxID=2937286 RepID=UPI00200CC0B1|nr:hypothetical protein [Agarivorans sp. TSD2052]UPW20320.1 hypothetical protein M0C34_08685 [Agarivorans sp. TSD2052]